MTDLAPHIADIARRILGEPNRRLSSRNQLRFGTNGSIAIEIGGPKRGEWFDHENNEGGGPADLIRLKAGISNGEIGKWLDRELGIKPNRNGSSRPGKPKILAAYDYRDEKGALLFQVCRLHPKTFRQRRRDGNGGWEWSTKGTRMVPYRLPELVGVKRNGQPPRVFIVEGEKDADRLKSQWGLLATTNPGGAGKWCADYAKYFSGFDVIVLPDNDDAGRAHAQQVATNLRKVATSVRILELPGLSPKEDVTDWLDHNSDVTQSDLETLVESAEPFVPSSCARTTDEAILKRGSSCMVRKIDWAWKGWLPKGKLSLLAGVKATGKSTLTISFMATITCGGSWPDGTRAEPGDVLFWSAEDDFEDTILPRFLAAGGNPNRLYFVAAVPDDDGQKRPFDPAQDMPKLRRAAERLQNLQLVGIDPVVLAIPSGLDSHKNTETRRGLQPLVDLAVALNIVALGVTHFSKGSADQSPIDRVTGSLAFGAVPRVVLAATSDPEGKRRRLVRVASNIGPSGGGFEYELLQVPLPEHDFSAQRINWGAQLTGSAKELLDVSKASAQTSAAEFLSIFLSDGPKPQREVKEAADVHCHSWGTVRLAQTKLGIKPRKNGKAWLWELPQRPAHGPFGRWEDAEDANGD